MRIFWLGMVLWFGMMSVALAEDNKDGNNKELPPSTTSKLIQLESRVSEIERKWFQIDRKIQEMNNKIFGQDKQAFASPKGRNVITIWHDNRMGRSFRVMRIKYVLTKKGEQGRTIYQAKRASITASMKDNLRIHQKALAPGDYVLYAEAFVRGYSPVFTYVNSYRFTVKNQMGFRVKAGQPFAIRAVFEDRGGVDLQKRFHIIFKTLR